MMWVCSFAAWHAIVPSSSRPPDILSASLAHTTWSPNEMRRVAACVDDALDLGASESGDAPVDAYADDAHVRAFLRGVDDDEAAIDDESA